MSKKRKEVPMVIEGIVELDAVKGFNKEGGGYASFLRDETTLNWEDANESANYVNASLVVSDKAMAMSEVTKMTKEIHDYLAKQWDSEAAYGVKEIAAKYKVKI